MPSFLSQRVVSTRGFAIVLVLLAGICWSTSGLIYRLMELATPWQVLFYRSLSLLLMLALWLCFRYGVQVFQPFLRIGFPAFVGGLCLSVAFTGFILALAHTSVANAMLILAAAPFFAALLGWVVLKEPVAGNTWICMLVAAVGVGIMAGEELSFGRGLGEVFALVAALGFSGLTVSLRTRTQTDMLPTIFLASCFATFFAAVAIFVEGTGWVLSQRDFLFSSGMGIFQIGLGFFLFTAGARYLRAVELTLISLTEIIAGPILVWFVLGEVPTNTAFLGGSLILGSIVAMTILGAKESV